MISTAKNNISIADYYFDFLKNLNTESKLELISKLSLSLKDKELNSDVSLQSLFGAYKSEETAEELIESIRASRVFNRNSESL